MRWAQLSWTQFVEGTAEILEVAPESLKPETRFRDTADGWSSMTGFALIVFMEDTFAISVDPDVFTEMNTLQELYLLVENSMKVRQTSC